MLLASFFPQRIRVMAGLLIFFNDLLIFVRVLYLAMSPDGQTIVTGAGDETLRFWNIFPGSKSRAGGRIASSTLFPSVSMLR